MSNPLRRRRIRLGLTGLLLTLLAAHSIVYFTATSRIEAALPAFLAAAATEGWQFEHGPPERSGWPWTPTIRLPHVTATNPTTALRWTTEQIDLAIPFQDLAALRVTPTGAQTLQIGPNPPLNIEAEPQLRIPLSPGAPATFSGQNLIAHAPQTQIRIAQIQGQALTPTSAATIFETTATGIQLTPPLPSPFAGPMALSIHLTAPPIACPPNPAPIELTALNLTWGPLNLAATATAHLDKDCQPAAQATLHVKGAPDLIEALARAGLIAPGPASAARAVLTLLALAAHNGPITLPVALANGTLTVAQFPLLRLPPLQWPGPSHPTP